MRCQLALLTVVVFVVGLGSDPDVRGAVLESVGLGDAPRGARDERGDALSSPSTHKYGGSLRGTHRGSRHEGGFDDAVGLVTAVRLGKETLVATGRARAGARHAATSLPSALWPAQALTSHTSAGSSKRHAFLLQATEQCVGSLASDHAIAVGYRPWLSLSTAVRASSAFTAPFSWGTTPGAAEALWALTFHRPALRDVDRLTAAAPRSARESGGVAGRQGEGPPGPLRSTLSDDADVVSVPEPWDTALFQPLLPLFWPWAAIAAEGGVAAEAAAAVEALSGVLDDEPGVRFVTVIDGGEACRAEAAQSEAGGVGPPPLRVLPLALRTPALRPLLDRTVVVEYCAGVGDGVLRAGPVRHASEGDGTHQGVHIRVTGPPLSPHAPPQGDTEDGRAAEDRFVQLLHAWLLQPWSVPGMTCAGAV